MSFIGIVKKIVRWFIPFGIMEYRNRIKERKEQERDQERGRVQFEKELKIIF